MTSTPTSAVSIIGPPSVDGHKCRPTRAAQYSVSTAVHGQYAVAVQYTVAVQYSIAAVQYTIHIAAVQYSAAFAYSSLLLLHHTNTRCTTRTAHSRPQ